MAHGSYSTIPLTRDSIQRAHEVIRPHIHRTPVLTSYLLDDTASHASQSTPVRFELFFKCENFQKVGAFKARGAFFNVMTLTDEYAQKGVCTHSSGNHAQALACAARSRGIPAHIVMPAISTPSKIAATKGYGANVHFSGSTAPEREALLQKVQSETGATFIPPYDYSGTILGQGTVALELEEQVKEITSSNQAEGQTSLDAVIAPLGGGGLLGGIATALSSNTVDGHRILVYGAEPSHEGADDARRGLASVPPKRIEHVSSLTIADGLRTPVGLLNWQIVSDTTKVAGIFAVSDAQIKSALRLLFEKLKVWVEPSAAVGLAVVLYDEEFRKECKRNMESSGKSTWRVGIVLTGGNTTVEAVSGYFSVAADDRELRRAKATEDMNGERKAEDVAG